LDELAWLSDEWSVRLEPLVPRSHRVLHIDDRCTLSRMTLIDRNTRCDNAFPQAYELTKTPDKRWKRYGATRFFARIRSGLSTLGLDHQMIMLEEGCFRLWSAASCLPIRRVRDACSGKPERACIPVNTQLRIETAVRSGSARWQARAAVVHAQRLCQMIGVLQNGLWPRIALLTEQGTGWREKRSSPAPRRRNRIRIVFARLTSSWRSQPAKAHDRPSSFTICHIAPVVLQREARPPSAILVLA